jgi:S-formylglutathione hydrolase FrmB
MGILRRAASACHLVTLSPCHLVILLLAAVPARASVFEPRTNLAELNARLHGHVVDHTHNHGADRRIWSPALRQWRDLYVYLPPGFDPHQSYPLVIWLHAFAQDEKYFLRDMVVPVDRAIACGRLPPVIVAAPDGSKTGESCILVSGTFFTNTRAGRFEDYLMGDIWCFLMGHYPIRPEREAHALVGVSMGGGSAYNLAIKYRDRFRTVVGLFPPVNLRWVDCHGNYEANFHPCCWGWRTDFSRSREVLGRFYGGLIRVHLCRLLDPLYDRDGPCILQQVSAENPIEMLDAYGVCEGDLAMYIAYGGQDEFNIDAQVESFLYRCRQRGLTVAVGYDPNGKHDRETGRRLLPGIIRWLGPRLWPFAPCPPTFPSLPPP